MSSILRLLDEFVWHSIFGPADYMGLHPPLALRLKIAARFPLNYVSPSTCRAPVFVVGCPRSGTTLLFNILERSAHLSSFRQESHWVWEFMHPPEHRNDHSQRLHAEDLTSRSERFIRACYGAAFGRGRFVDKCPTNSMRIGAVKEIFPEAKIVCITRNGPDNVSSLIDTWRDPDNFLGFEVPEGLNIEGYDRQKWVHLLQPGWQAYTERSIEEVCAHQWITVNRILRRAKGHVDDADWLDVRYEKLIESPVPLVSDLFNQLGLPMENSVQQFAGNLSQNVVNTSTPPGIGKWRRRNPERIRRVMPMLASAMEELGMSAAD
jgi:hypothetical protein